MAGRSRFIDAICRLTLSSGSTGTLRARLLLVCTIALGALLLGVPAQESQAADTAHVKKKKPRTGVSKKAVSTKRVSSRDKALKTVSLSPALAGSALATWMPWA